MDVKRWLPPGEGIEDAAKLRLEVFVEEQGFSREAEFDAIDAIAHHLVVYDNNGAPAATGRIFADKDKPELYHAGRIAVSGSLRGAGIGRAIMAEMEAKAAELGAARLTLSAQCRVRKFYEKCGYTAVGEEYLDEHCPHIDMEKEV